MKITERFAEKIGESLELDGYRYAIWEGDKSDADENDVMPEDYEPAYCVFKIEISSNLRTGEYIYDMNYSRNTNEIKQLDDKVIEWFKNETGVDFE